MRIHWIYICIVLGASLSCCTSKKTTSDDTSTVQIINAPEFNADSAYTYVQAQVDFGPRVPNTAEHVACGKFLAEKLAEFGATITNQYMDVVAYDGTILKARNIIGSYQPELRKRVLLFAHWDTRPWADHDPDEANHRTPISGANDGASGVGVLLEIARQIQQEEPAIGIDIIFFDAEDYGTPQFHTGRHLDDTWCLGSQYWSRNPHVQGYYARYGILLDMVGGKDAQFYRESISDHFAKSIVDKVWQSASRIGYGKYFINQRGGAVTDDHLYVNRIAGIPSIDIIPYDYSGNFGDFWHTLDDNIDIIDRQTLKAVGQTVLEVIYNEK